MNLFKYTMLSMLFGSMIAALALNANAQSRLWVSDTRTDGNIGDRSSADAICNHDKHNPKIEGMETRAFIAFNASDNMQTMASKFKVPVLDGITRDDGRTLIANNYGDLFNTFSKPLINSVTPSHHNIEVWTGASDVGLAEEHYNCHAFTSADANTPGEKGTAHAKDYTFLAVEDPNVDTRCSTQAPIYCLSFTPHH